MNTSECNRTQMKSLYLVIIITIGISFTVSNALGFLIAETPLETYHGSDVILIGKITSVQEPRNFTQTYHL